MGTVLAVIALLVGIGVSIYVWLLRRELALITRRLDRYNRALFATNDELRQLREESAQTLAVLQAQVARSSGQATFDRDMTVRQVYALHPQAQDVLAAYHLGGCSSCAIEPDQRLGDLLQVNGLPAEQVLQDLNQLFRRPADTQQTPALALEAPRVKLPNMQLELE